MGEQFIHTFSKGINQDLHKSVVGSDTSLDITNFRLIESKGETTGALETVEGNMLGYSTYYVTYPGYSNPTLADDTYHVLIGTINFNGNPYIVGQEFIVDHTITPTIIQDSTGSYVSTNYTFDKDHLICGSIVLREKLYLFTTTNIIATPISGESNIYEISFDSNNHITSCTLIYTDSDNEVGLLLFSTANPITGIGRYETNNIKKIYWVDGFNPIRFFNASTILTNNGLTYAAVFNKYFSTDKFEFLSDSELVTAELNGVVSGNIYNGTVQYAYQLYRQNGSETSFSETTDIIHVTQSNEFESTSANYRGSSPDENSGKGFKLKIDLSGNDGYNRMRVVAIHHSTLDDESSIRIAGEINIDSTGDVVYFTDTGESYGLYTLEEFSIISNRIFVAQDIKEKDDRLFAANISEESFDITGWDSRSYRFNAAGLTRIYDIDGSYYTVSSAGVVTGYYSGGTPTGFTATNWEVPETADCINWYNDLSKDGTSANEFLYTSGGTKLGSTGKNISLEVTKEIIKIDKYAGGVATNLYESTDATLLSSYTGFANPYVTLNQRHLQSGETYRIGIQFSDGKGRWSFPQWVTDFRLPRLGTNGTSDIYTNIYNGGASDTYIGKDGLRFKVNVSNKPSDATGFRLMYVPRSSEDRTIRATGVLERVLTNRPDSINGITASGDTLVRFISPEVNFNKNISQQTNDRLSYVGYIPDNNTYRVEFGVPDASHNEYIVKVIASSDLTWNGGSTVTTRFSDITDMQIVDPGSSSSADKVNIASTDYYNYNSTVGIKAKGGTVLVIAPSKTTWDAWGKTNAIVQYERDLFGSQYGGNTYEVRSNNEYIPLMPVSTTYGSLIDVSGGDTFSSYFDYASMLWDLNFDAVASNDSLHEALYIPNESSINCDVQLNKSYSDYYGTPVYGELIQEYSGTHKDTGGNKFYQEDPLYQYNSVYSQVNNIVLYSAKPFDFVATEEFDTRVLASNRKYNGEESDSWTKFATNEYIDVQSKYGPINNLYVFKDRLMYFQDKAFGTLSVNDRALIQDNNPGKLVLGTGDLLNRYDYISENVGNKHKLGIINSNNSLYWFYDDEKALYVFTGNEQPLSKVKGLQSWFSDHFTTGDSMLAVYDNKYNEVLFTPQGSSNGMTVAYNEFTNSFGSFYNFKPSWYARLYTDHILSSSDDYIIYLHNVSTANDDNRCTFYGTIYAASIEFIVNDKYNAIKVFDNIFFNTEEFTAGKGDNYEHTFDKLKVYNSFQNSGEIILTKGSTIERRENEWYLAVPRNAVDKNISTHPDIQDPANIDQGQLFKARMRDNHMIIKLTYDTNEARLVVPYVGGTYRYSRR